MIARLAWTMLVSLIVIGGAPVLAQHSRAQPARTPAAQGDATAFDKKLVALFGKPLHPIIKSVAPGGGFGPGIAYKTGRKMGQPWAFRSEAVMTPRAYWNLESTAQYQSNWLHGELYGRVRKMTHLSFYGIGNDTTRERRTSFTFNDRSAGGLASVRFPSFDVVAFGGRVEGLWPDIDSGKSSKHPSIEQRFTENEAPGLASQPAFAAYTAFVNVNYPGGNALGRHGVDFQVAFSQYQDRGDGRYGFARLNLESQQRIPGLRSSHKLTLHEWLSTTDTDRGDVVPFYLQHTLGGAGAVRPVSDEILGSDATKATLRGFQDLRFRGPHLLLLQAEYRCNVHGPFDATVFVDAGTVAMKRPDLGVNAMKANYGVSLSFMTIDATAFRLDVGTGGGEGTRVFFSVGPIFQQ